MPQIPTPRSAAAALYSGSPDGCTAADPDGIRCHLPHGHTGPHQVTVGHVRQPGPPAGPETAAAYGRRKAAETRRLYPTLSAREISSHVLFLAYEDGRGAEYAELARREAFAAAVALLLA